MSISLDRKDLAERKHWDHIYSKVEMEINPGWEPLSYDLLCLENMLLNKIDRFAAGSILEVGCGNSAWLPYLAKKRNLRVFGLDYSERGCELARKRLAVEKVDGTIYFADLFEADIEEIGNFDLVYSLGVVEHFSDPENVLSHLLKFVKPGGGLLTVVPNLYSLHGIMSFLYQPELLRKHRILKRKVLLSAYKRMGLSETESGYAGIFSLGIVAWGVYQRFPSLDKVFMPIVNILAYGTNGLLVPSKKYNGTFAFAPFLYAIGKKVDSSLSHGDRR